MSEPPTFKFRWLSLGDSVRYVGRANPALRGQVGVIATLPRPGKGIKNVLVHFPNGVWHIVPFGTLRKVGAATL